MKLKHNSRVNYKPIEGSTEEILSQQNAHSDIGSVRHEATVDYPSAGGATKTSKEIIDACWGKYVPEKPTAPYLVEEALRTINAPQVRDVPTKFFTPVKISDEDKQIAEQGFQMIANVIKDLLKPLPPKEKTMAELDWLYDQKLLIQLEMQEAEKHNNQIAKQSRLMLWMWLTQINKRIKELE